MSLSHIESMSLSHPSSQEAHRPSWKPWFLFSAIPLLLCFFGAIILTFFPLKTAKESCVAKFGPLPLKWQMASPEPPCMSKVTDWKLKILQNGLYLIYGQVAFDVTYKGAAPFDVRLRKNEANLQILTNSSQIQTVGGAYELHTGDTVDLIFNSGDQVLKNNTYWGIILVSNLQFIS
ncbi:tumor necrosis factor ligand superfamily member 18 [Ctenodactylus gundi]